ncbi:Ap-3 adaptor complex subunit mu [Lasiodiplodia theobromae]|uniref:Ap-3 adaptor complex subunit mu n=1 Tax=Lasiodiplodia theobromae TaxID=45133 RepID=UPI0015C3ABAD|nr:Ap-3 adaptor complex subunit mu [Lasiodiplodia theobromae]KAF4537212.1 Ap-3 adaptor complex subunit mu [Lasiodiplodia theobromae]
MSQVEALYIFDEHNNLILEHVYCARPPSAQLLLPLYLAHPAPRPSLVYLPATNPPTLVHSIIQDRLLFLAPSSVDTEPLLVIEFLHRVADAIEDFLGSPLLATKIEAHYDVVAQLLGEMCDAGIVANTEGNALRDVVEAPSVMKNLLGNMGLPSSSPALGARPSLKPTLTPPGSSPTASPVPWRRANVRHTSNELYVDVVETLSVTLAPSGRPISAFANGSIAFTSKVSGIPDLILRLEAPGGVGNVVQLPVFHPCVRLARWRERPGELSFVPPDGRFVLAGYEVDLLGPDYLLSAHNLKGSANRPSLNIPANVEVKTGLGPAAADFEVRLSLSPRFRSTASSSSSTSISSGGIGPGRPGPGIGGRTGSGFSLGGGIGGGAHSGTSAAPLLSDVLVRVPLPAGVRNLADLRPSRGEAQYAPGDAALEWRVSSKDVAALLQLGMGAVATLRGAVVGAVEGDDEDGEGGGDGALLGTGKYDYDDGEAAGSGAGGGGGGGGYQSASLVEKANGATSADTDARAEKRRQANRLLMPSSAALSFQVKGWLASGVKVESLNLDQRKSRGLGAGVTPYKGVKYLTVSRDGVEVRC